MALVKDYTVISLYYILFSVQGNTLHSKHKIGRNSPCPCGSGKKYKRCCGKSNPTVPIKGKPQRDYLTLNEVIAYKGKVGKMREDFCKRYIEYKKEVIENIEKDLTEKVAARGETITCHKGCSYCCSQYIAGTLQEVEAIVYYLYKHETALNSFTRIYPEWRAKVRENEAVFTRVKEAFNELSSSGPTVENQQNYLEASRLYLNQNIPCPFLDNDICSIYEVRPWPCASVVAVTPGEWCSPANANTCDVRMSNLLPLPPSEMPYFRKTSDYVLLPIPLGIYEILNGGFIWLSDIPGLEGLDKAALTDPIVQPIIQRYL